MGHFLFLVFWIFCTFWIIILCQIYCWQRFATIWWASFHIDDCFFCFAEVLWFYQIPLVNCWATEILSKSLSQHLYHGGYRRCFLLAVCVLGFMFKSLIHLELVSVQCDTYKSNLILVRVDIGLLSTICRRCCPYFSVCLQLLCQMLSGWSCKNWCLGLLYCSPCLFFLL